MIPMEELEGRLSGLAHRQLVASAVGANMNTLRVWGGGIFLHHQARRRSPTHRRLVQARRRSPTVVRHS